MWVRHDPLLLAPNFHQSQFLNFVVLSVEDANSGSSSVNGQSSTNEGSSGLAFELFSLPNTVDRSNGEVAVDDRGAVDWVKSHEVAAIFIKWVELKNQKSKLDNSILTVGFSSEAAPNTTPDSFKCLKMISSAARSISDWSLPNWFFDLRR